MSTFIIIKVCFSVKPTCAFLGEESMNKYVRNPLLQFRVLLDLSIILVVVAEHSLHKPLRNVDKFSKSRSLLSYMFLYTAVETKCFFQTI